MADSEGTIAKQLRGAFGTQLDRLAKSYELEVQGQLAQLLPVEEAGAAPVSANSET
jgi:hypothetical protein